MHLVDGCKQLPWRICHDFCSHLGPPATVQTLCGRRREQNSADRRRANPQKGHCGLDRAAECPSRPAGNRHHYQWHCPQAQAARPASTRYCPSSWHTVLASDMPCSRGQSIPLLASCSQTRSNWGCRRTCNQRISIMHTTSTTSHNAAKRAAHGVVVGAALHAPGWSRKGAAYAVTGS